MIPYPGSRALELLYGVCQSERTPCVTHHRERTLSSGDTPCNFEAAALACLRSTTAALFQQPPDAPALACFCGSARLHPYSHHLFFCFFVFCVLRTTATVPVRYDELICVPWSHATVPDLCALSLLTSHRFCAAAADFRTATRSGCRRRDIRSGR